MSTAEVSRTTLRERAIKFAASYAGTTQENAEAQTFWNDFFKIFDVERRQVALFEKIVAKASGKSGKADLLYPGQMAVEHKTAGKDLDKAMQQLWDYLPRLPKGEHPWLLVACDFHTFKWEDLDTGRGGKFPLAELPDHLDLFAWIAGHARPNRRDFENEEEASLEATKLLAVLHDRLAANRYPAHPLREWLTRILFCLFAEDTGVWPRATFHAWIATHTREDGSDLGSQLNWLFQILDTAPEDRPSSLDETLVQFTYINGDLFEETLPIPACDQPTRDALLEACKFDWSALSPAIFGSMFQNVMASAERRQLGAHYTSERDILRTLEPLFLNDLRAGLDAAKTKPALERFLDQLSKLKFFDPACGCGNFLVVAYREIRKLETNGLRRLTRLQKKDGQLLVDVSLRLKVTVDQFYGIEIEEFPAKIARTALYLIDHLANRNFSSEFGEYFVRFPIPAAPHIVHGNALTIGWNNVLPAGDANFVFGNPPYVGSQLRDDVQQAEHEAIFGQHPNGGKLDYVANWFALAAEYGKHGAVWFAFVATNSLTQGIQAAVLGRWMNKRGMRIDFAHRTFKWISEASGAANVYVVIVGFSHTGSATQRHLWDYSDISSDMGIETKVSTINWYLVDAPDTYPTGRSRPLSPELPRVGYGSTPIDNGNLIVESDQYTEVASDPHTSKYLRKLIGARELVRGDDRWCLWLVDLDPADVNASRVLRKRLEAVQSFRQKSSRARTRELAATPHLFADPRQPDVPYTCIPRHVSHTRRYYTVARYDPDVIASDATFTAPDPDGFLFAVISSSMFIAWQRAVGGRIKADLRFSNNQVWNTLPLPAVDTQLRQQIIDAGLKVLDARAEHSDRSLAEHYNPLAMTSALVKAHSELGRHVDRAFGASKTCATELERQKVLFDRYVELTTDQQIRTRS